MTAVVIAIVAVVLLGLAVSAHLAVAWLKRKETASTNPVGVARGARAQIRELKEMLLSNQETFDAYAARQSAAAAVIVAATAANTASVDQLRAELAAGSVEIPLDVTQIEAATVAVEQAAASAVVPSAAV